MTALRRALGLAGGVFGLAWLLAAPAAACSPPLEEPTIGALGAAQVVVVGTIGERVPGGRLFHVERSFNGGVTATPIVIVFKEGEPVGDCSYPVSTGASLIIAPYMEPDGRLSADLATLQADPSTDVGRKYLGEAIALFGPGVVPEASAVPPETSPAPDVRLVVAAVTAGVAALFAIVVFGARERR